MEQNWIVTFECDIDKLEVGNAKAIYHSGQADEFIFEGRIGINDPDKDQFIINAKAALEFELQRRASQISAAEELTNLLNK